MPTRRQFLIAGGVAAFGVLGGVQADIHRTQLLHDVGLESSPDRTFPDAHIPAASGSFRSRYMPRPLSWSLAHPAAAITGIVDCLHGYHEDHRFVFDTIHLPDVVAAAGVHLAVAAVDGGADSHWHARADCTDALAMLLDELVPMIAAMVGPVPAALLGWSMGGYGALLAAETAPGRFKAGAAASPALWTSPGASAPGAFDSPTDFYDHDVFRGASKLTDLAVRIDCGTGDPFYPTARQFASVVRPVPHETFGPGYHDAAYWRSVALPQIQTIANAMN